jgi:hypothetical protein
MKKYSDRFIVYKEVQRRDKLKTTRINFEHLPEGLRTIMKTR